MNLATKTFAAATLAFAPAVALAADLPSKSAAPKAPAAQSSTWTGFYLGATAGYNFFTNTTSAAKPDGASLGLRAGYDHQISDVVLGILIDGEKDFGKKSFSGTYLGTAYRAEVKHPSTLSIDLKAGYLLDDKTLIYALGGYTHSEIKVSATVAGYSDSASVKGNGWNIGAGAEYRFTREWSGFGEYRFNQVKKDGATIEVSQIKAGVAYRF
jgi:outer membrane immunogenic protein